MIYVTTAKTSAKRKKKKRKVEDGGETFGRDCPGLAAARLATVTRRCFEI